MDEFTPALAFGKVTIIVHGACDSCLNFAASRGTGEGSSPEAANAKHGPNANAVKTVAVDVVPVELSRSRRRARLLRLVVVVLQEGRAAQGGRAEAVRRRSVSCGRRDGIALLGGASGATSVGMRFDPVRDARRHATSGSSSASRHALKVRRSPRLFLAVRRASFSVSSFTALSEVRTVSAGSARDRQRALVDGRRCSSRILSYLRTVSRRSADRNNVAGWCGCEMALVDGRKMRSRQTSTDQVVAHDNARRCVNRRAT